MLQTERTKFQLRQFPMPDLDPRLRNALADIEFSELAVEGLGVGNWPVGFELRLYQRNVVEFLVEPPLFDCLSFFNVEFEPKGGADVITRPAIELAAFFIRQTIEKDALDVSAVIEANRILGGSEKLRTGLIGTTSFKSGQRVLFDCRQAPDVFLVEWLHIFLAPCPAQSIIERAIWLFLNFLIAHPFEDGNGRTARLMLQAFLKLNGILSAPLLPIGPCMAVNQRSLLNAAWGWEFFGNKSGFFNFMFSIILKSKEVACKEMFGIQN